MREDASKSDRLFVAAQIAVIVCCLITVAALIDVIPN